MTQVTQDIIDYCNEYIDVRYSLYANKIKVYTDDLKDQDFLLKTVICNHEWVAHHSSYFWCKGCEYLVSYEPDHNL